ncbi:sugar transferase [Kocuria flava]|uniref:sugar transferase n=1 Tax=Kocuria flava TaxID=446860 RepID=UPI002150FF98|nr:sugar transferase [Kocuria flava]
MLKQTGFSRAATWRDKHRRTLRQMDAIMVVATVIVTQFLRFGFDGGSLLLESRSTLRGAGGDLIPWSSVHLPYWLIGVALGVAWWVWLDLRGTRETRLVGHGLLESKEVVNATLVLFGAIAIVSYALNAPTARSYVLIALPLGLLLLLLGRGHARRRLLRQRTSGVAMSRTMVAGCRPGVVETVKSLQDHPEAGFDAVAVYVPNDQRPLPARLTSVAEPPNTLRDGTQPNVNDILQACRDWQIEVLVLCASAPLTPEDIRHLSWYLADEDIRLILDTGLTDIAGPRIHTQHLAGLPLIHVSTPRLSWSRRACKRGMDVAGATAALMTLLPIMAILSLIVKRHDGGPVFFAQERIGLDGTRFRMLKFRSMYTDAEQRQADLLTRNQGAGGVLFKMKDDPRVTKPGRWMRRYSLDELPQFVNVLKGEMSLVGPRPPLAAEVEKYEDYVHRKLRVKPGITGLWQVSGRSDLDWEQSVRLDLYYVENWSPVQDLIILFRTLKVVVTPGGAY